MKVITAQQGIPYAEAPVDGGFFCAAELHGQPVPEELWHVEGFVPGNTVTILNGDGGVGKSLVALQLAIATALGAPWLGLSVPRGRALFLTAEDERAVLHRRLANIAETESFELCDLDQLSLRSLAGCDALLADLDPTTRKLRETALYGALASFLDADRPALLVLDTLADLFGGDEINRAQARQFIGMLRRLAIEYETAIVLLAHPSLSGMASGSGSSGSTAWNNSVRSRLYLQRVRRDGEEPDPNARTLEVMKANYGATGLSVAMRWQDGRFVTDAKAEGSLDRMAAKAKAERVFLKLLRETSAQGRHVSHNPGPTFAPSLFAKMDGVEGCTSRGLREAMERLFAKGSIRVAEHGGGAKARKHIEEVVG
ncbi:RecA-family ATPase [Rhodobacter viridis]|uniref:RecA-family ATPase n=1 Tax=Rhodobacter viridis TaxID=1054202 RepID=A0A318U226_9RHOB|nr:AAA family ATPase [Rhodobacter viridis]PYF12012.1 RecA-family ATPase [Rhodobacter viridis]